MVFFNMLALNKQSISSNHIRRVADNVSSVMMEQQQDLKNLQQTNPKKLHFSSPKRSRISSSKSQHKNLSEMFTADHLKNVQVFQRAWKEMEASRERCNESVVTFQTNPKKNPRLKDFKPFDLEEFWGQRQLAKMELDVTDSDASSSKK